VDSKVGHGSRFTISLPWHAGECADEETDAIRPRRNLVAAPDVDAPPAPMHRRYAIGQRVGEIKGPNAEPDTARSQPLVLIADDNVPNVDALSEYLSIHACRLEIAHNGLDAVDKARRLQPQLILMDIQMPELDGIEATRRIRSSEGMAEIPIVALTAAVMPGDRERCLLRTVVPLRRMSRCSAIRAGVTSASKQCPSALFHHRSCAVQDSRFLGFVGITFST
jgi:CheY-like chemotaxis protein